MKKTLAIFIGLLILGGVLAAWLYLLFFGSPETGDDIFANLGIGDTTEITPTPAPVVEPEPEALESETPQSLRQLTTRPVAGFAFLPNSTVIYAEKGIGHVYQLDLTTGAETRLSGTTIPLVHEATFAPDGTSVVLRSVTTTGSEVFLGDINSDAAQLELTSLPATARNITYTATATIRFSSVVADATEGYRYDLSNREAIREFTIPLRDVLIQWQNDTAYAIPRYSRFEQGAIYEITDRGLTPVTTIEYGFVGGLIENAYIYSFVDGESVQTEIAAIDGSVQLPVALHYLPEKCAQAPGEASTYWCLTALENNRSNFTDEWYKDTFQSQDSIWSIDTLTGQAAFELDLFAETNRILDAEKVTVHQNNQQLLFSSKVDNTLWLYDASLKN